MTHALANNKLIGTIALALGMALLVAACIIARRPSPEQPPLLTAIPSVVDFGSVSDGTVVNASYRLRNVSKQKINLLSARADCGCVVPTLPPTTLLPGRDLQIPVSFDSARVLRPHPFPPLPLSPIPPFPVSSPLRRFPWNQPPSPASDTLRRHLNQARPGCAC